MNSAQRQLSVLRERRDALRQELAQIGELRPGSLVPRYRRCGKPTCHCARPGAKGHGPSWSLTRRVGGKTRTHVIPAGPAVDRTRAQLAEYRRFRQLCRELVEVSDRLCQAEWAATSAADPQAAEKRGSRRF